MYVGSAWFLQCFFLTVSNFSDLKLIQPTNLNFKFSSIHHHNSGAQSSYHLISIIKKFPKKGMIKPSYMPCVELDILFWYAEIFQTMPEWTETMITLTCLKSMTCLKQTLLSISKDEAPIFSDTLLTQWTKIFWMNTSSSPKWFPSEVQALRTKLIKWKINDC